MLEQRLKDIIATSDRGFVGLDLLMALAAQTYYKEYGLIGQGGDFATAPELGQLFGEVIGFWLIAQWLEASEKARERMALPITLVELGPGRGTLMSDVLRVISNAGLLSQIKRVLLIEGSEKLQADQAQALGNFRGVDVSFQWFSELEKLPHFLLSDPLLEDELVFIIANEFFDALPVKQFIRLDEGWRELVVGLKGEKLVIAPAPYGYPDNSLEFFEHDEVMKVAPVNSIYEYSPGAGRYFNLITDILQKSHLHSQALIIDYGYLEPSLHNSIRAIHQQRILPHFLERYGEADISALVDFGALSRIGRSRGMGSEVITQREFLLRHGIRARAANLMKGHDPSSKLWQNINWQLHQLLDAGKMGEIFKAMIVNKAK